MNLITIGETSSIPLFGLDFIGIIDRGTNIIEVKPITLCNLKCKYCFVNAGEYENNFVVDVDYLLKSVKRIIEVKGNYDIEIHIAPYGESLLYTQLFDLIQKLWEIKGVERISMQTNGLLLEPEIIQKLHKVNLTRINISLNTLNKNLAEYLCNCKDYDIKKLLFNIESLINSDIDVLLAPVWFPKINDEDIIDIIMYVKNFSENSGVEHKIQLGIQKYLTYQTGRKLRKIRPKSWDYFYKQLARLEKKHGLKLKLGPNDFGIHRRKPMNFNKLSKNQIIEAKIVSQGRWNYEFIGKISERLAIKLLVGRERQYRDHLIGKTVNVKIIKANRENTIITSVLI